MDRIFKNGTILHLDGDRKYSIKSEKYYKNVGLNAIVKHIPEYKQPYLVLSLLEKYKPDILIITGHDAMIKKNSNYYDIRNYKNSKYFINTVKQARYWVNSGNDLVIFAGACESFFEAIMESGANFASSPARIQIDFKDPLIVAEKIALADENDFITINDIEPNLRDGIKSINGVGARGKRKTILL